MLKIFLLVLSVSWCVGQYVSNDDQKNDDRNKPCLEINLECPKVDGEFPVYSALPNCSQFCQCSNGKPYLHDCPSVLHFNPVLNVCDYPENAGCISNVGDQNGVTTETNDDGTETNPCIELGIDCPEICGERPIYLNLTDCSQYCECYNGKLLFRECPGGLHFNVNLEVCDFPERAGCDSENDESGESGGSGDGDDEEEEENSPCIESGVRCPAVDGEHPVYAPLPNCSQFCQCSNGKPYLHNCPADLHFNPILNVCDYPDRAGCKDNGGGSSENEGSDENGDDGDDDNNGEDDNGNSEEEQNTTSIPDTSSEEENNPCIESGVQCPAVDGEHSVYAPLPNCSQFCQCSNGKPYLHNCPADLHFNSILNVCDYPDRAGCKENGGGSSENEGSDENGDDGDDDNNGEDDNGNSEEEENTTSIPDTSSEEENNPCIESGVQCPAVDGEHSVYAPLPNCSQFCQCSNGKPYLHNCPADLHFNPILNVCDYPDRVGCKDNGGGSSENEGSDENGDDGNDDNNGEDDNGNSEEEESTTSIPDTSSEEENNPCIESGVQCPAVDGEHSVYAPLPNCSQFCQCSNGKPYLHNCPADLHFNPILNVCDYPDRAGCKDNGGGSSENEGSDENGDDGDDDNNGEDNNGNSEEEENTTSIPDTSSEEENNPCIESGVQCPAVDGEHSVYAPLPNCSQFCQCSNGKPYLHNCPADLHFNPILNVCDYPDRAGCKDNGGGSSENEGSDENGDDGNDDNNGEDDNGNSEEEESTTSIPDTSSEEENNPCIESGVQCPAVDGEHSVYAPLPNCSQFCQCSNAKPYLHNCPADLHFNPILNVCDYPDRAGCKDNGGGSSENEGSDENGDDGDDDNNGEDNNGNSEEEENTTSIPDTSSEEENNPCIESGVQCPAVDGEHSVYAPLPNCSQFCQCSNGKPYLHNCPADLHFNPILNVCDYPDRAGCKDNGGGSSENEGSDENGDDGDDDNNGEDNNGNSEEEENTTSIPDTSSEEENNPCIESGVQCPAVDGEHSVYAPLPNCSQFCQCSNGKPYLHNCPADLHFNPILNVCDYPDRAGCKDNGGGSSENEGSDENGDDGNDDNNGEDDNGNSEEEESTTSIPDTSSEEENNPCIESGVQCPAVDGEHSVYAPLPNCSQFCQCSNGKPYLHNCPADLHFNPILNVCDYPDRAGCKDNGGGSSENEGSDENGDDGDDDNNGEDNNGNSEEEENTTSIPDTSSEEENNPCIESGVQCPAVDGEHSVYAPLPNCSQFCQCSNGKPYLHNCPADLHFNPILNVCDYPDRAGCKDNGGGSSENEGSDENGDDGNDDNNGEDDNGNSEEEESTTSIPDTSSEEENNPCIESGVQCPAVDGEHSVYAPLPNCSQFCQCSNGKPYLHNCPADLHFNPILNVCDYPDRAGCKDNGGGSSENEGSDENGDDGDDDNNGEDDNGNSEEEESTTSIPDTSSEEENNPCIESGVQCPAVDGEHSVYAPLPNCSQFCQCSNGKPYLHNCPADLHFNPILNVCDYPDRAGCKDNGGGSSENEGSDENGDDGDDDNNGEDNNGNSEEEENTTSIPDTSSEEENNPCIESGVQCPAVDGEHSVYAPLPNCSQFCQCSNGKPYLHNCPADLHFNPILNVCDYPDRAGCKDNGGGSSENEGSDENGDDGNDDNNGEDDNGNSEEEESTTSIPDTSSEEENNPCIESGVQCPAVDGEHSVYAPLPNCSQFCQCSNGKPYLHNCPADLHFNPILNLCDYPDRAGCKDNGGGSSENEGSDENGDDGDDDNNGEDNNGNSEEEENTTSIPDTSSEEENNPCIESGVQCPAVDGEHSVYAPLPNCSQFCQCSNGKPYLHNCPADLHFNPILNVCDYPDRAGCKDNGGGSSENEGSDENGDDGNDDNNGEDDNGNSEEEESTTSIPDTSSEEENNPCIESGVQCPAVDGEHSVYAPLPNCSQFCQCSNGKPYLHNCPADLHFNPILNVCDYPDRAGCKDNGGDSSENEGSDENGDDGDDDNNGEDDNGNGEEEESTTSIPDTSSEEENNPCIESGVQCPAVDGEHSVYAPLPNCSQFCQCSNGKPYLHNCPADLHFNPILNVCDYPDRAGCKDNGGGSSENEGSDENGDDGDDDNNGEDDNGNGEEEESTTSIPDTSSEEENNPCIESGVQCPAVDGEHSVYAPLPNCSQFCQCSNGKPYLHNCPADLHFNPILNVCDYPDRAGCKDNGGDSSENEGSDENGDDGDDDNNGEDDNGNGEEEESTTSIPDTSSEEENNPCIESGVQCPAVDGEHSVYAPLPNCSQFCQCSNGKPYLHNCPADLHFNPILNVCDYPDKAGCKDNGGGSSENEGSDENGDDGDDDNNGEDNNGNSEEEESTTSIPDTSSEKENNPCIESGVQCPAVDGEHSVYAPLPNCSQFCQCSNGKPYLHNCPADLHFNPILNVCDYPDRAGCKDNGGGSSENEGSDENGDDGNDDNNGEDNNGNSEEEESTTSIPDTSSEEENNPCIESGVQCPAVDGEHSVYAPLPNCSQFCQCSNGKPYLHNCPEDLHFNPVLNVCDHPENAGCANNGESGDSDEVTGGDGDKDKSNEDNDNDNGDNGENDGNEDNNNSNENDDNGNGDNGGTSSEESNVCLESGIECPKVDGEYPVYAPLPNCSQFCQCSNGKPYLHNCSADLHFNPVLNVCDYPDNAGCANNGGSGESDEGTGGNGDKDKSDENNDNDNGDNGENDGNEDDNNSNENGDNGNGDNGGTSSEESNVCLESGIECPKIDGEYPVYAPLPNCSQFCQCSNGKPYLHNCSADLHFNPVLNVCDYPENAGCANNGGSGESDEGTGVDGDEDKSNEDNDNGDNGENDGNEDNNNSYENDDNGNGDNGATSSEESNVCLESGIECPKVDGEYPVYAPLPNCSQFCQCSNGKPYLHNCSADLHFNPVLNVCDYPERAGCKGHGGPQGSDEVDDENVSEDDNNGDDKDSNTSSETGIGPEEENSPCSKSRIDCPEVDGQYPVYAPLPNCSQFCQCSNGQAYLFECPGDLHFNPNLNVCDYDYRAGCASVDAGNDSESDGPTNICLQSKIECPEVDGNHPVYAPLPDCSRFCQCSNGKPYLHNCTDGLHFNPTLEICDYPDYAGCVNYNKANFFI